jgi:hypothetical protein
MPGYLAQGNKRHIGRSCHFTDAVPTRLPISGVFRLNFARRPYPWGSLSYPRLDTSSHYHIVPVGASFVVPVRRYKRLSGVTVYPIPIIS